MAVGTPNLQAKGASPFPVLVGRGVPSLPLPTSSILVPLTGPSFRAEPLDGSEQEKATYCLHKRRKILRLVSQWVLLYGRLLQGDRSTTALLQVLGARGVPAGSPCHRCVTLSGVPPPYPPIEPRRPGEPGPSAGGHGAGAGAAAAPSVSPMGISIP